MARVEIAPEVADDLDRILDHLLLVEVEDAASRVSEIVAAVSVLEFNPLIGRLTEGGKRELVIGRGARSYLALYRYIPEIETVFILAVRSAREAGYPSRP